MYTHEIPSDPGPFIPTGPDIKQDFSPVKKSFSTPLDWPEYDPNEDIDMAGNEN